MEEQLVSIIIPVYKVEKYLRKCLDSVLAQTYSNFEVILVDDGSPDHSPEICDEYAAKDSRVRVIHKENGGVSTARNIGIENTGGGYTLFVDSDDVIHPDILRQCVEKISAANADAVVFGVSMNVLSDDNETVVSKTEFIPDSEIYTCEKFEQVVNGPLRYMFGVPYAEMEEVLYHNRYKYMQFPWSVCWLYRTNILKEYRIRFREDLKLREDGIFNCEYLMHISRIACVPEGGYEYNKRSDGAAATLSKNADVKNKIALVNYRSQIVKHVYERSKIDIAEWAYGSYALSVLQLSVALSDKKGGFADLKTYLKLDEVKKAIKGVPLKGSPKMTVPLFLAKIGFYRLMYLGIKLCKKFIKV